MDVDEMNKYQQLKKQQEELSAKIHEELKIRAQSQALRNEIRELENTIHKQREEYLFAFVKDFIKFLYEKEQDNPDYNPELHEDLLYENRPTLEENAYYDVTPGNIEDGIPSVNVFSVYKNYRGYDITRDIDDNHDSDADSDPEERVVVAFSVERSKIEDIIKKHNLDKK